MKNRAGHHVNVSRQRANWGRASAQPEGKITGTTVTPLPSHHRIRGEVDCLAGAERLAGTFSRANWRGKSCGTCGRSAANEKLIKRHSVFCHPPPLPS